MKTAITKSVIQGFFVLALSAPLVASAVDFRAGVYGARQRRAFNEKLTDERMMHLLRSVGMENFHHAARKAFRAIDKSGKDVAAWLLSDRATRRPLRSAGPPAQKPVGRLARHRSGIPGDERVGAAPA